MGQKLFEFAIIHTPIPTKEQAERGEKPKSQLLVAPQHLLADSDKQAATVAARAIPETYIDKLDQVEVVIRPF